jgi:glycosyltransferase involved in cell wall biosynthesis
MPNNWDLIEKNEMGKNANGGTEMFMRFIYDGTIDRSLLENVQIIPGRVRDLEKDKIRILTLHDLPEDPECVKLQDENYRNLFHKIVFISNWQYQQFRSKLNFPYSDKSAVIESAIVPLKFNMDDKPDVDDTVHICYTTTPHRGLNILCAVFEELAKQDKKVHLHVHSSFKIYGWDEADKQFEELYKFCENHPQVTYYGYTPHDELMKKLPTYHIQAYPSVWEETSCRSVLEAMSAGLACVHPNFGALIDTTGGLNFMYDGSSDVNTHANIFFKNLLVAINVVRNNKAAVKNRLIFNKNFIDTRFNPDIIYDKWKNILRMLNDEYPTVESRIIPETKNNTFVYKTAQ